MTEEIPATPGWLEDRLDTVFAPFPPSPGVAAARRAYSTCLASRKAPAAPSDTLGAEFNGCRTSLRHALQAAGIADGLDQLDATLEAVEAELAGES